MAGAESRGWGKEGDFGFAFDAGDAMDVGAGAGAGDCVIHVLRAGLSGAHEQSRRERNGIEAFARAGPFAGSAQAIAAVVFGRGVGSGGAVTKDFEVGEDDGARIA